MNDKHFEKIKSICINKYKIDFDSKIKELNFKVEKFMNEINEIKSQLKNDFDNHDKIINLKLLSLKDSNYLKILNMLDEILILLNDKPINNNDFYIKSINMIIDGLTSDILKYNNFDINSNIVLEDDSKTIENVNKSNQDLKEVCDINTDNDEIVDSLGSVKIKSNLLKDVDRLKENYSDIIDFKNSISYIEDGDIHNIITPINEIEDNIVNLKHDITSNESDELKDILVEDINYINDNDTELSNNDTTDDISSDYDNSIDISNVINKYQALLEISENNADINDKIFRQILRNLYRDNDLFIKDTELYNDTEFIYELNIDKLKPLVDKMITLQNDYIYSILNDLDSKREIGIRSNQLSNSINQFDINSFIEFSELSHIEQLTVFKKVVLHFNAKLIDVSLKNSKLGYNFYCVDLNPNFINLDGNIKDIMIDYFKNVPLVLDVYRYNKVLINNTGVKKLDICLKDYFRLLSEAYSRLDVELKQLNLTFSDTILGLEYSSSLTPSLDLYDVNHFIYLIISLSLNV